MIGGKFEKEKFSSTRLHMRSIVNIAELYAIALIEKLEIQTLKEIS
jgi:hypothetical protein